MRVHLEYGEGEAVRPGAEAVAVGPRPEHQVEEPVGPAPGRERGHDFVRSAARERRDVERGADLLPCDEVVERRGVGRRALAEHDGGEPEEHLPVGRSSGRRGEHRR